MSKGQRKGMVCSEWSPEKEKFESQRRAGEVKRREDYRKIQSFNADKGYERGWEGKRTSA